MKNFVLNRNMEERRAMVEFLKDITAPTSGVLTLC